jgi:formiminotetrahydrofolate cyclodeaminase
MPDPGELQSWLQALAGGRASPAAGSAAALSGAMGVALLIKVARLTAPDRVPGHARLLAELLEALERLQALAHADAAAIDAWIEGRRSHAAGVPRQEALAGLVAAPLEAAELCRAVRLAARPLLEHGFAPASLDGQVGVQLLRACERASCTLVRADLGLLADRDLAAALEGRLELLEKEGAGLAANAGF